MVGILVVGSIIGGVAGGGGGSRQAAATRVGIGSTIAQMVGAHGAARGPGDVCSATNSCFGSSVTNEESGNTFQFTYAMTGGGLILYYQQNFTKGTTATSAVAQVLNYLPKDAAAGPIVVGHTGSNSCGLLNITSPTIGRILTKAGQAAGMGHPADELGIVLEVFGV